MKLASALGVLGGLASGALVAGVAHAYVTEGATWSRGALPIPYKINLASSQELGATVTQQVVEKSFGNWAAPACSAWRTTDQGNITGGAADPNDRQNVLVWLYSSWPSDLGGSAVIGVTTPVWFQGGSIVDADIQFNGHDHQWTTNWRTDVQVDAESIITHETGHFLGLGHSTDPSATMFATYPGGNAQATLAQDDINGVCALYPSAPGSQCSSTHACPTGQTCDNGYCISAPSAGQLGDPCTEGCATNFFCVCTDMAQQNCFCTKNCSDTMPCPTGWNCNPLQAGGGACLQAPPPGTGQLGDPCMDGSQCANGLCVSLSTGASGICTQSCTTGSCPSGYNCGALQGGGGACIPIPPQPDGGTTPADAGTPQDAGVPVGPQPLGSTCAGTADCASHWCAYLADGSGRVCTTTCGPSVQCPDGFVCGQVLGGTAGCLVDQGNPAPDGGPVDNTQDAGVDNPPAPTDNDGGGIVTKPPSSGCSMGASDGGAGLGLALLLVVAFLVVRRRRA
jgi:MYXO-CTERM domain-containing protein